MPVLDHEVHPSTQKGPEYRAGCWSKPRPTAESFYWAKDGEVLHYCDHDPKLNSSVIHRSKVFHTMSTACRVLDSDVLPECQGCTAEKDVEYIKMMKGLK